MAARISDEIKLISGSPRYTSGATVLITYCRGIE